MSVGKTSTNMADMYGEKQKKVKFKFNVDDLVKISKTRRLFEKATNQSWTEENFVITERIPRNPPMYKWKYYDGEIRTGTFYEHELQRVVKTNVVCRVEEILREQTRNMLFF